MLITLYAESRDGRLRYYTIHDRRTSRSGAYVLTTAWRIESARGRERRHTFSTAREMDEKLRSLFRETSRRGYKLLYCFDRRGHGNLASPAAAQQSRPVDLCPGFGVSLYPDRAAASAPGKTALPQGS